MYGFIRHVTSVVKIITCSIPVGVYMHVATWCLFGDFSHKYRYFYLLPVSSFLLLSTLPKKTLFCSLDTSQIPKAHELTNQTHSSLSTLLSLHNQLQSVSAGSPASEELWNQVWSVKVWNVFDNNSNMCPVSIDIKQNQ